MVHRHKSFDVSFPLPESPVSGVSDAEAEPFRLINFTQE